MHTTLRLIPAILLLSAASAAIAGPTCTTEPESKWISEAEMTKRFQALGYKDDVKKLHVSKGKCWEIYGTDQQGRKVEVYFHPITGAIAEENVKN
ncbi:PepSY domain-containing protein [Hydrogenophaga taeniospiralis]|uniref:PepSY domain-containing protein n=1 Tax=Hydrogenophaga taeniospiralis TaxID=65656 RepID=UPI001CFB461C|nr:PepSY domain-containing protein [Hydrogenophaga taeniospiralis]MCB4362840.1 PepSY domain-containing protein [Hydrogenophaga taeniospiralis]